MGNWWLREGEESNLPAVHDIPLVSFSGVSKMHQIKTATMSIATDQRLVLYGLLLLTLHIAGTLFLYKHISEFDILPHTWFGYVLSEYSSKGATSINLQLCLTEKFQKHGWTTASFQQVDFLVRLAGFLLVGGLFLGGGEIFFISLLGIKPDSFFAFPITMRNIDGALDVTVGTVGAMLAFLIDSRRTKLT